MKEKLSALETYRGFAAIMIAAVHFNVNWSLFNNQIVNGYYVQLFFTLSGFVIYLNYKDKITNFILLKKFIFRRFLRLYPLHFLFLIVFLIIEILKYIIEIKYNIAANNSAFSKNNLISFFYNLLMLQVFLDANTFNTPSWSISSEFFTYVIFAAIIISKKNYYTTFYLIIALVLFYRINHNVEFGISHSYFAFLDCIYSFMIGVVFCKLSIKYSKNKILIHFNDLICLLFIILSITALFVLKNLYLFLLPVIFGFLLFFSKELTNKSLLGKVICNKIFIYLGKISYSIYMCHLFVFWVITQFCRFALNIKTYQDGDLHSRLELSTFQANIIILASYVLTIVLAHFTYGYVEKKFYKN